MLRGIQLTVSFDLFNLTNTSVVLRHVNVNGGNYLKPLATGARGLSWLVFLGGLSAGIGMIVCETMTIATMVSNHLFLPALAPFRRRTLAVAERSELKPGAQIATFAAKKADGSFEAARVNVGRDRVVPQ